MPGLLTASVSRAHCALRSTVATSTGKTSIWSCFCYDARHCHSANQPEKTDIKPPGGTKVSLAENSSPQGRSLGQEEPRAPTKVIGGIVVVIGLALLLWWRSWSVLGAGGSCGGGGAIGKEDMVSGKEDPESGCGKEDPVSGKEDLDGGGGGGVSGNEDPGNDGLGSVKRNELVLETSKPQPSQSSSKAAIANKPQKQCPSTPKLESWWALLPLFGWAIAALVGAVLGVSAVSTVAAACSRMVASSDRSAPLSGQAPFTSQAPTAQPATPPPPPRNDWFSHLFGFSEVSYAEVKQWLRVTSGNNGGGLVLESLANGACYDVGVFLTPSLSTLQERSASMSLPGRLTVTNELGDVAEKHADSNNRHATFQVASQFNCLEFTGPRVIPEDGVTGYVNDRTQGPACSIACGPATAFRNFFAPVDAAPGSTCEPQEGQTQHRMIDNLAGFSEVVGNVPEGRFFRVQGGYSIADEHQLSGLNAVLGDLDAAGRLGEARKAIRIGIHQDVEVTSTSWGKTRVADPEQRVTQAFVSACAVAYNKQSNARDGSRRHAWEAFGRIVLEACYEATLLAGIEAAVRHGGQKGSRKVFLTCVGGGVFGNPMEWIADSMRAACEKFKHCDLDVRIVTYAGSIDPLLRKLEQDFKLDDPAAALAPTR